ncbi:MAG: hypothetical protein M3H12_12645 [Chromatiales bacterium]|nr:hypothetical protein [Gammaproteobacteria bacterium]
MRRLPVPLRLNRPTLLCDCLRLSTFTFFIQRLFLRDAFRFLFQLPFGFVSLELKLRLTPVVDPGGGELASAFNLPQLAVNVSKFFRR